MTDRILTRPGADIAYSISGSGPVVVSAHGLTSSRSNEDLLGLSPEPLAAQHTVVRYDARGHGRSTGKLSADDYRWSRLADDLLALIDEVSPDAPVDAIGASMGCGTVLHAVLRDPERFRRLVLVIPPTAWETRSAQVAGYETMAKVIENRGIDAFLELAARSPNPPAVPADLVIRPDIDETLLPVVLRGAARSDLPPADEIAGIAQPVLILAWTGDPTHPLSTAERLLALLPHARMQVAQSPAELREWTRIEEEFLAP
ncbi:alpha/beta fold hydrolase [Lysinimonas soli]|uniref:Alpha/beta fold hydrolase n=1 Tax=Lysinimonas soli TaxID=1074233 RepID=A0ABW0NPC1_9MICO